LALERRRGVGATERHHVERRSGAHGAAARERDHDHLSDVTRIVTAPDAGEPVVNVIAGSYSAACAGPNPV
jgi:hypothetical protein